MADLADSTRIARVALELLGSVDHLRLVWQTGEALLEGVEFAEDPAGERFNTLVAVQEMVTNVLRHAHGLDDDLPVRVIYEVHCDRVVVEVHDRGEPFDPRTWLDDNADDSDEEVPDQPGGFGILIAALVMDGISYHRRGEWNVLTLTRRLRRSAPPHAPSGVSSAERAS